MTVDTAPVQSSKVQAVKLASLPKALTLGKFEFNQQYHFCFSSATEKNQGVTR